MLGIASLQWVLTAAFSAAALFHLVRCARPVGAGRPPADRHRTSEALHLVMCVAMIAMLWPWGARVPAAAWIGTFTVSAGWFVTRTVRSAGRRWVPAFFATSAAAMIWMGAAPAHASPGGGQHHGMAMADGSHVSGGYAAWISAGIGGYLMLAALWWVIRGMRLSSLPAAPAQPTPPPNWAALCHGMMSAGMAVALLAMV
jgi:hypothetical protein